MKKQLVRSLALPALAFALLSVATTAQGIAPLHQIATPRRDSRIPIQSLPGSASAKYVVTEAGSYVVVDNVQGAPGKHGIEVLASDVTIDLQGFVLAGVQASLDGIRLADGAARLVLRNGTIRGWGGAGVHTQENGGSEKQCRFELLRSFANGGTGLGAGEGSRVERCIAAGNSSGIVVVGGHVDACLAPDNALIGMDLQGAGAARRAVARNTGLGSGVAFRLFEGGVLLEECVANRGSVVISAAQAQKISTVRRSLVAGSLHPSGGIQAFASSVLVDNLSTRHASYTFNVQTGLHHVEGNLSTDSAANAFTIGGAGVAVRNASTGNAAGDNWNFTSAVTAGSFLPPGQITASNPFGHPLF